MCREMLLLHVEIQKVPSRHRFLDSYSQKLAGMQVKYNKINMAKIHQATNIREILVTLITSVLRVSNHANIYRRYEHTLTQFLMYVCV